MEPLDELHRGLVEAAPDALVAVDPEGTIRWANDQVESLFGWTHAELVGQPVERLIPSRFAGGHPALRSAYMERPSARAMGADLDLWARRKDGSEFAAEISLRTFTTSQGPVVAAAIRDVTDSRRAEHRLRAVLTSAPDALLGVGGDGRIRFANDQAALLFGWATEELVGASVDELVPTEVRHRHLGHRDRYMASPDTRPMGAGLSLSARRRDGTTFPAEISLSSFEDEPGERQVLVAVRDVTERLELESIRRAQAVADERERSHRLESLGQLAGGVAHDFNNLLGVILAYASILSGQLDDPAVQADLAEITAAAQRGAGLTNQLLTFARRDMANPEPLDLVRVVDELSTMLARTLGEHIDLQLDSAGGPLVVLADKHQVEQIILNLAINARDAMPGGGALVIGVDETEGGDAVRLRVVDSGTGMPAEVVDRAFEPFFTTKPTGEGTGLGLATVYGIVQRTGGTVTIDSVPGEGTAIEVVLPAVAERPRAAPPASPRPDAGTERVLVVEDERALRVATARVIGARGYEVLTAEDGLAALELLTGGTTVDLVVTDIAMPRMRGDEMARQLAAAGIGTPVLFVTGYDSGGTPPSRWFLEKPVAEDDLLRMVREVLDG